MAESKKTETTYEFEFELKQIAKSEGGDKYECETLPKFNIYIPQTISRTNGNVKKKMLITISPSD
jgi:hypothetical protein